MTKQSTFAPEQIACIYAWLAQLFSRELDSATLVQLQSSEMMDWFTTVEQEPVLTLPIQAVKTKVQALIMRNDAQLELAADFCSLFLMSDKQSALPYASVYPNCEQGNEQIKYLLAEAGMETNEAFREPSDHISIFLELLSHLHFSLNEAHLDQEKVRQLRLKTLSLLLQWLPIFSQNCQRYDEFGFYAALSQLSLALVQWDKQT
ncbi:MULTISPECIES: molecular chaperone TorD [Providencia]|uniref:molecular chaperone TorD n=1 Tax=Providencia TaxID=586 RepID=UPI000D6FA96F|nr:MULTISPECIES: molecular chaperone TorD [Providencia]AWS52501.1 molecular chaperone TorD [Providencia rettgeri]ELH9584944.1 molecular chaperone TorD [Providencia rettgeri]ELH9586064.1 molecular chaperone TorD [Providencia rettgeri]ELM3938928.1 molecular chaperone TorD [Providencia rettgeri]ELM3939882.1 molecular chaperone TorD [Providencia rettgeri]